jgi:hypothetical protein
MIIASYCTTPTGSPGKQGSQLRENSLYGFLTFFRHFTDIYHIQRIDIIYLGANNDFRLIDFESILGHCPGGNIKRARKDIP